MVKTGGAEVILVFSLQREKEIIRFVRNSVWPRDELINLRHFFFYKNPRHFKLTELV